MNSVSYKHYAAPRLHPIIVTGMTISEAQSSKTRVAWRLGYLVAAVGIYLMDQSSKAWALRRLRFTDRTVIHGVLDFVYAENPGIAFGQLQEGGSFGRWFFVVLAALAAIAVFVYFVRTARTDDRVLGACALLLAGILGNMTDRVRLGFVIDFILVHAGQYRWPAFNVADASIMIGASLLAYDLIFSGRKHKADPLTSQRVASDS